MQYNINSFSDTQIDSSYSFIKEIFEYYTNEIILRVFLLEILYIAWLVVNFGFLKGLLLVEKKKRIS